MTQPARTSRTPSIPPLPFGPPPDLPSLPQMGAIGSRIFARNWMNSLSSPSAAAEDAVRRRLEVDAVGGAIASSQV